jgi:hypothetical protein
MPQGFLPAARITPLRTFLALGCVVNGGCVLMLKYSLLFRSLVQLPRICFPVENNKASCLPCIEGFYYVLTASLAISVPVVLRCSLREAGRVSLRRPVILDIQNHV